MADNPDRRAGQGAGDGVVAAAMRGERDAQRELWERHRRWVAAVLLAHKPALEDLDDLLQEVAVIFVSKLHTVRVEQHVRAWLRTVAINVARASARSGRYRPRTEAESDHRPGTERSVGDAAAGSDQARRILARLDGLDEAYREPLLLRVMHGMRSKQIGELLDIPPATVDTRITRARRMLREEPGGSVPSRNSDSVAPVLRLRRGERDEP